MSNTTNLILAKQALETQASEESYYKNQLEKLTDLTTLNFVITDYQGNKTNNMKVCIDSLIPLLEKMIEQNKQLTFEV